MEGPHNLQSQSRNFRADLELPDPLGDEEDENEPVNENFDQVLNRSGPYLKSGRVNEAEILLEASGHQEWKSGDTTFRDLPKFDSLTAYGLSLDEEKHKWQSEIQRIAKIIFKYRETPFMFQAAGLSSLGDFLSIENIVKIADAIQCNLEICAFDMATVILENRDYIENPPDGATKTTIFQKSERIAVKSRKTLFHRFMGSWNIEPRPPQELDSDKCDRLYLELVDYVTGLIALLLHASASGESWDNCCLSTLAKLTAKLKYIRHAPRQFAEQAMIQASRSGYKKDRDLIRSVDKIREKLGVETKLPRKYFRTQLTRREDLFDLAKQMLLTLIPKNLSEEYHGYIPFEINTMVSEQGYKTSRLVLCSDRRDRIQVSTDPIQLWITSQGCEILLRNAKKVNANSISETGQSTHLAKMHCKWRMKKDDARPESSWDSPKGGIRILTVNDYVTMVLSSTLCSSFASSSTRHLIEYISTSADPGNTITVMPQKIVPAFEAVFIFTTIVNDQAMGRRNKNWVPLSQFPLLRHFDGDEGTVQQNFPSASSPLYKNHLENVRQLAKRILSRPFPKGQVDIGHDMEMQDGDSGGNISASAVGRGSDEGEVVNVNRLNQSYRNHLAKMDQWHLSESSVTVSKTRYVVCVSLLFFGGLVLAALVVALWHGKLEGIDLSNIFNTIWIIGGFCVILAKSWSVNDWPWHDFMHCKLKCTSVEEIALATGIDSQVILMYLLKRDNSKFQTCGPYNSFFINNDSSGSSFTVNAPCKLSTLICCGFVILMVSKPEGDWLVCIGGREKDDRFNEDGSKKRLACKIPSAASTSVERNTVLYFKEKDFTWDKGYGICINDAWTFG